MRRAIPHRDAGAGDGTRTRTGLPPTVFKANFWLGRLRVGADFPHSDAKLYKPFMTSADTRGRVMTHAMTHAIYSEVQKD